MIPRICRLLLAFALSASLIAVASADPPPEGGEAPLRLKKKPRPPVEKTEEPKKEEKTAPEKKAEEKKAEPKEPGSEEPALNQAEEDEKELMERIERNVRTVEERLANKQFDSSTKQLQEDILKDIEALIRHNENGGGGGGGGADNQQDQSGQDDQQQNSEGKQGQSKGGQSKGKGGQSKGKSGPSGPGSAGQKPGSGNAQRQQARAERRAQQLAKGNQRGQSGTPKDDKSSQQGKDNQPGGADTKSANGGAGGEKSKAEPNRNADLYKDVWGHLPEALRAEMNAYAGRQEFMAKHEALIKKYYSTIAAEGRKKSEKP